MDEFKKFGFVWFLNIRDAEIDTCIKKEQFGSYKTWMTIWIFQMNRDKITLEEKIVYISSGYESHIRQKIGCWILYK